ncbi:Holliday junction branch migration protein RuvA [Pseudemcibacter aquimaris]|uniref:Holliday junction branch migration protein RuvA n=1 Tax=Pseudemcibacter aquimaris TaxID=2857064 RepID=UPI0020133BE1|nr:Holliday junction branch migration protein RuvA [Pseudemcibacter aquimaris]MCC3862181.1 Holliday junction branch migration protein RuvA [Pseudemcibacter aquimaris]WDU58934.1 Holliday junction branch migration protein RuvA [Pseudemcibacter aquimaris]
MIAKLRGLLDSFGDDWCIVDVNGVGYYVFCSSRTLDKLNGLGEEVTLLIETHIREDHFHLFGFATELERDWFTLLQSVQGVGAKVALAILSAVNPDELSNSIAAQDKTVVGQASGVGPKLATRIVNELKDKVAKFALAPVKAESGKPAKSSSLGDAVSALTNLGYKQAEAFTVVNKALNEGADDDVQTLIRLGLKELAK